MSALHQKPELVRRMSSARRHGSSGGRNLDRLEFYIAVLLALLSSVYS